MARPLTDPQDGRAILARNLKKWRTARNMSQARLAELSGLNRTFLSMIENMRGNISLDNICRLAAVFRIRPQRLFDDDLEDADGRG